MIGLCLIVNISGWEEIFYCHSVTETFTENSNAISSVTNGNLVLEKLQ